MSEDPGSGYRPALPTDSLPEVACVSPQKAGRRYA